VTPQDFAPRGRALGQAIGLTPDLDHHPARPEAPRLAMISRRDHGEAIQAPTAILRFALPKTTLRSRLTGRGFARFAAGDLPGVLPEGSAVPRFHSLASASRDGFVEIVVKKHPGGLCSGQLPALEPGDRAQAFLRRNPGFHAGRGRVTLILIGAGTGIASLAGSLRANARRRPVHLFFRMRHVDSDVLHGDDLAAWAAEGKPAVLATAISRGARRHCVQNALRTEATEVAKAIRYGARVMVCGRLDTAQGAGRAFADTLSLMGLTPAMLKAGGCHVEEVH
jgi:sulfite reductase (NADPH) flavoprotein alpha-component